MIQDYYYGFHTHDKNRREFGLTLNTMTLEVAPITNVALKARLWWWYATFSVWISDKKTWSDMQKGKLCAE
jgi:hypothetical protein